MSKLRRNIQDQRVLNLIRKYLNTGVDIDIRRVEGVPQGSPLSPLLSNIYLHMLDTELTKRGHKFVRYADDCQIFVKSSMAATRVMQSISRYLNIKLKLRINNQKSKIRKDCEFLGYVIDGESLKISGKNLKEFKYSIRKITRRAGGNNLYAVINKLNKIINGWYEYFKYQTDKKLFSKLDSWIRRRMRMYQFCALKTGKRRLEEFMKVRMPYEKAYKYAYTFSGPWRTSAGQGMCTALSNKRLKAMGLPTLKR